MTLPQLPLDEPPYPQVCLACGRWLTSASCGVCGHAPDDSERPFHSWCVSIASNRELWPLVIPAKISPLAPAGLSDVRAVVSAMVLGLVAGASCAAVRNWLLSRHREFRTTRGHTYDFERLVDAVGEFFRTHPPPGTGAGAMPAIAVSSALRAQLHEHEES